MSKKWLAIGFLTIRMSTPLWKYSASYFLTWSLLKIVPWIPLGSNCGQLLDQLSQLTKFFYYHHLDPRKCLQLWIEIKFFHSNNIIVCITLFFNLTHLFCSSYLIKYLINQFFFKFLLLIAPCKQSQIVQPIEEPYLLKYQ